MKLSILIVVVFATNACFGACLQSILNSLAGPLAVNNVVAPTTATVIPPPILSAIFPPALSPVIPLLNAIFPQGCPAPIVNAILTANLPTAAGIAAASNGIGVPNALSLLSGQSVNLPSLNLPFRLTGSNIIL